MKLISSKEELRSIYKAVIRSLIVFHGLKHMHVAAILEMRQDTFSKWFCSGSRSLSAEEMKLFCEGLTIPVACIDNLVNIVIKIKNNNAPLHSQLSTLAGTKEASLLETYFNEEGYFKIILEILGYLTEDYQIKESSLAS